MSRMDCIPVQQKPCDFCEAEFYDDFRPLVAHLIDEKGHWINFSQERFDEYRAALDKYQDGHRQPCIWVHDELGYICAKHLRELADRLEAPT